MWYKFQKYYQRSNEYPQSMFWAEVGKISEFYLIFFFSVFGGEIFYIFE